MNKKLVKWETELRTVIVSGPPGNFSCIMVQIRKIMRHELADILLNILFVRLYTEDKSKDHSLMCKNTILTLGHIAVALRHELRVSLSNTRDWHRKQQWNFKMFFFVLR
jgi:hypothetical protein